MSTLRRQVVTEMLLDLAALFAARNLQQPEGPEARIRLSFVETLIGAASRLNPTVPVPTLRTRVGNIVMERKSPPTAEDAARLMTLIDVKVSSCPGAGLTLEERQMVRNAVLEIAQGMVPPDVAQTIAQQLPPMIGA